MLSQYSVSPVLISLKSDRIMMMHSESHCHWQDFKSELARAADVEV